MPSWPNRDPRRQPLPDHWRAAVEVIADAAGRPRTPSLVFDIVDDPPIGRCVRHFDQTMQAVSSLGVPLWDRLDIVTAVNEYVFATA